MCNQASKLDKLQGDYLSEKYLLYKETQLGEKNSPREYKHFYLNQ